MDSVHYITEQVLFFFAKNTWNKTPMQINIGSTLNKLLSMVAHIRHFSIYSFSSLLTSGWLLFQRLSSYIE